MTNPSTPRFTTISDGVSVIGTDCEASAPGSSSRSCQNGCDQKENQERNTTSIKSNTQRALCGRFSQLNTHDESLDRSIYNKDTDRFVEDRHVAWSRSRLDRTCLQLLICGKRLTHFINR